MPTIEHHPRVRAVLKDCPTEGYAHEFMLTFYRLRDLAVALETENADLLSVLEAAQHYVGRPTPHPECERDDVANAIAAAIAKVRGERR